MKKIITIIAVVLTVLFVLSFAKNIIARTSVSAGVKAVTGLKLSMRKLNIGVIRTLVEIKDLKLHNPQGFPEKLMVDMPQIYVDYDLGALFKKKVHLQDMKLNLKEFIVVKNETGELNLDSLKVVQAQKEGKRPEEQGKAPEIQIDALELKVGRVLYKDYSKGEPPSIKEFKLNLNERYENISNPYSLVSLIVVKALMNTTIARVADFDLQGLQNTVSDTLASAQKVVSEATAQAKQTVEQTKDRAKELAAEAKQKTQEAVEETSKTLEKTKEQFKGLFKSPLGSEEE